MEQNAPEGKLSKFLKMVEGFKAILLSQLNEPEGFFSQDLQFDTATQLSTEKVGEWPSGLRYFD